MPEVSSFLNETIGSPIEELLKQFVDYLPGSKRPKGQNGKRISVVNQGIDPERFKSRLAEADLSFEEFYEQFALLVQLQERFTAMPMPIRNV